MNISNAITVTATKLAEQTGEIVSRVHYSKQPAIITRRGRPVVVILPVDPETGEIVLPEEELQF